MGISRLELWNELGGVSVAEPILIEGYQRDAERDWRGEDGRIATSFYVSSYPGTDPLACARAGVYSLMGLPQEKPFDIEAIRWMEAGKALEMDFIRRFAAQGKLLSGNEEAGESQTKFGDPTVWSSGAVDAIILPYGWRKGHCVEIKNTSAEKMAAMRANREDTPWSHKKYVRQIKTYIGYAYEQKWAPKVTLCEESWAITKDAGMMGLRWCPVHNSLECKTIELQLEPPDDGTLIYASRDPQRGKELDTFSYYFGYDAEHMRAGRAKLAEWRALYEQGILPPHVLENERKKWTADPCRFCPAAGHREKGGCKADYAQGITKLADSTWIPRAREIRPHYDYAQVRAEVFKRWGVPDPLKDGAQ